MKKSTLLRSLMIAVFSVITISVFAQGEANVWQFYTKWGLNFNDGGGAGGIGAPVPIFTSNLDAGAREGEGCSSVCDSLGNLLFYTNGVTVYDKNGTVMTGGNGTLLGDVSSTQSAVIVPAKIAGKKYYYIFTSPPEELSQDPGGGAANSTVGLCYSIVDMSANGNLGAVISANIRITPAGENASEGLTVIPHFTDGKFWVFGHQAASATVTSANKFYIYEANAINTTSGVITFVDHSVSGVGTPIPYVSSGPSGNGQVMLKSNSCFNLIAYSPFSKASVIELYNFNNTSGAFSLAQTVTNFDAGDTELYGLEFSPKGGYLYVSALGSRALYQFDITPLGSVNLAASRHKWSDSGTPATLRWGQLQLGPDGKIYMAKHTNWDVIGSGAANASLGVINDPDQPKAAANFSESGILLTSPSGIGSKHGLPQIYKGFLAGIVTVSPGANIAGLDQVCVGEPADFEASYTQNGTNWQWNIDANVGPNTSIEYTTQNITHTYTTAGTYQVVLTLQDATCLYTVTEKTNIIVNPIITSAGTVSCGPPVTGTVTSPNGAYRYVWYANATPSTAIASGTSVSLPVGTSGNVYLRAEANSTATTVTPSYFPTAFDGNSRPATNNTMPFTVNTPVTVTSFQWSTSEILWSGPNIRNYTIAIRNAAGTVTYWSTTRSFDITGGLQILTETPNVALPTGTYQIYIFASGTTNPNSVASWDVQYTMPYAPNAAVSFAANGAIPVFVRNFTFSSTTYAVTPLACSKVATIPYNCPLPVTWLSFTGVHHESGNTLTWITVTEEGAGYFDVERSIDGVNFEYIGRVNASGYTSQTKTYNFFDAADLTGVVYYRLRQVDIDGRAGYSSTIVISSNGEASYSLLPNPGDGIVYLIGIGEESIAVNVLDIQGRTLKASVTIHSGSSLDLSGLPKGVYLIQIIGTGSVQTLRYVLQ